MGNRNGDGKYWTQMVLPGGAVWVSQWEKAAQGNPGISGVWDKERTLNPPSSKSQHLPLSQGCSRDTPRNPGAPTPSLAIPSQYPCGAGKPFPGSRGEANPRSPKLRVWRAQGSHQDGHPGVPPFPPRHPRHSSREFPWDHLEVATAAHAGAGAGEHGQEQRQQRQPGLRGSATNATGARPRPPHVLAQGHQPVPLCQAWGHGHSSARPPVPPPLPRRECPGPARACRHGEQRGESPGTRSEMALGIPGCGVLGFGNAGIWDPARDLGCPAGAARGGSQPAAAGRALSCALPVLCPLPVLPARPPVLHGIPPLLGTRTPLPWDPGS